MMSRLLDRLRSSRGRLVALGLVALSLGILALIDRDRPRARWVVLHPEAETDPFFEFSPDGLVMLTHGQGPPRLTYLVTGQTSFLTLDEAKFGVAYRPRRMAVEWMHGGRLLVGAVTESDRPGDFTPSLHVWDVATGRECFVDDDFDANGILRVSDDGSTLVYTRERERPAKLAIWKGGEGEQPRDFPGSRILGLSSHGRFLTTEIDAEVVVWDVGKSERVGRFSLPLKSSSPYCLAVSPDGRWVASYRDLAIDLYDVASSQKKASLPQSILSQPWFSPDGLLLYSRPPDSDSEPLDLWNLADDPPSKLFEGRVANVTSDGRRWIQRGDHLNEYLRSIQVTSWRDPVTGRVHPTIINGPVFQKGRGTSERRIEGSTLAYRSSVARASWLWEITRWLPPSYRPWKPDWRLVETIEVIEADSGRSLRSIPGPDTGVEQELKLVRGGETLLILSYRMIGVSGVEAWQTRDTTVEVWDVHRASWSPITLSLVAVAAVLALGLGGWYDRGARRRARSGPLSRID